MSVSNTSFLPSLTGGSISLETIKQKLDVQTRRTKIICTLGPACWEVGQLETLLDAGMDVARFNFSHGDHKGHAAVLQRLRQASQNKQRGNTAVLLDTKGPEIRTGFFGGDRKQLELKKGETIVLTSDYTYRATDSTKLACSYSSLATSVKLGQEILVADGSLVLTVIGQPDVASGQVKCRIENNAIIGERKNMNLPGVVVDLPTFTAKDIDDIINFGIRYGVDYIAPSFVRKASDVCNLRQLLAENNGQHIKIICKIENLEGLQNYQEILQQTDGIMVARGDLGMEIPPSKVFLAQKMMIREANIAGKPVITATQMLESMICNPRPTRAECSDVANAVYDGTDCVMLSGETANGQHFEEAVRVMARTCSEAEGSRNYNALFQAIRSSTLKKTGRLNASESLASSAVKTAVDLDCKFILVVTETGTTARYISKFRPGRLIICVTPSPVIARQCSGIYKGVHAYVVDGLDDTDGLITEVCVEAVKAGIAKVGDNVVVVCGKNHGSGFCDQVMVEQINEKKHLPHLASMKDDGHPEHGGPGDQHHLKSGFRRSLVFIKNTQLQTSLLDDDGGDDDEAVMMVQENKQKLKNII